jgi:phasin family protein
MAVSAKNSIRDQNVASIETARDGARQVAEAARQAAETTQETIRTAMDTASRAFQSSADQIARSFGLAGEQGEDLTQQSTRNLEAITECGAVLARGFQEITREWLSLAQHRAQKNLEGVQALASCRNVQDVVAAQTEFLRDNIREIMENSRQIAETSVKVADEAAQALTGPQRKSGSGRLHRAA